MTIWLAVIAGTVLGYVLASGDFCFHSTWRRLVSEPIDPSPARAYVVFLIVATPLVQLLDRTGVIDPYVPPFTPAAAIVGGLIFGGGMVVAQTCVSGMVYKLGTGMVGMVVAIAGWAVGDIITWQGPLQGLRSSLTENVISTTGDDGSSEAATVVSSLGFIGVVVLVALGAGAGWWIHRRPPTTVRPGGVIVNNRWALGAATAAAVVLGWLLVAWHGGDYSFGTSGVPNQIYNAVTGDEGGSMWIPLSLVSLVPGAVVAAATRQKWWLRGESGARYAQLGVGGMIMGVGAAIAGGCNLGHSMVGVPLLSVGSIVTTVAIIAGVFAAARAADRLG
ncbi:MAG: YeeE/YedE family protein [Actinomycetota bacterium]|nr:YeeE/YedE family protein [Actinomycetota bacterium]